MKQVADFLVKIVLFVLICLVFWWSCDVPFSVTVNLIVMVGGVLLTFPLVWIGRSFLIRNPTPGRAAWITTFIHFLLGFTFGVPMIRAIVTGQNHALWDLPVPTAIGLPMVIVTGAAFAMTVLNLALKGFGAPFFISLSRKLAIDWLYAWTRNPMVLAVLAFLLSLGIWLQSGAFLLWILILFAPALLFFIKVYEERELEIRFGQSYLEYKSRTPMLFPRRPIG